MLFAVVGMSQAIADQHVLLSQHSLQLLAYKVSYLEQEWTCERGGPEIFAEGGGGIFAGDVGTVKGGGEGIFTRGGGGIFARGGVGIFAWGDGGEIFTGRGGGELFEGGDGEKGGVTSLTISRGLCFPKFFSSPIISFLFSLALLSNISLLSNSLATIAAICPCKAFT